MTISKQPKTLDFAILNAFTDRTFGGNPAAVVFLDNDLPFETMLDIAKNFNQPITTFISKPVFAKDKTAKVDVRWFSVELEPPLCGHAILATSSLLFTFPEFIANEVDTILFHTQTRGIIASRKVEGNFIEIEFPAGVVEAVSPEEHSRVSGVIAKAFGRENVAIKFIGSGKGLYDYYLLIELDEKEDLAGSKINTHAFTATEPYFINVVTTSSPEPNNAFVTRMFAPRAGVFEDPVCGSAQCLLAPYWSQKLSLGKQEISSKQVSARGGDLKAVWEEDRGIVRLRGTAKLQSQGQLFL